MDLFEGEVAGNEVGANVQVPGYDLERLRNEVQYRDNTVNLDATSLPVPSSAVPEGF
ncbi:MAG: hypothetical protein GWO04_31085 [Actinobacteria bacterium]|nr:hypothetical protein [Actinomycetota bacterium]